MEIEFSSQYVARSVTDERISNAGREHINLEGQRRNPVSALVDAVRRIVS